MAKARTRILAGALILALPAGAALAQGITMPTNKPKAMSDEEMQQKAEQERAYKSAIGKIPDQKPNADPWGNVRGASTDQNKRPNSK